mmetsp:Transcript_113228/g.283516  ORF Transcript_113228/g.283516 Transcript_113228/m.283516 type:complete len:272 (+) Transcript_113228:1478-2293(+)
MARRGRQHACPCCSRRARRRPATFEGGRGAVAGACGRARGGPGCQWALARARAGRGRHRAVVAGFQGRPLAQAIASLLGARGPRPETWGHRQEEDRQVAEVRAPGPCHAHHGRRPRLGLFHAVLPGFGHRRRRGGRHPLLRAHRAPISGRFLPLPGAPPPASGCLRKAQLLLAGGWDLALPSPHASGPPLCGVCSRDLPGHPGLNRLRREVVRRVRLPTRLFLHRIHVELKVWGVFLLHARRQVYGEDYFSQRGADLVEAHKDGLCGACRG